MAWALVQWLKLPALEVGDREFEPTLAFKFQRNKMWRARPQTVRAQISDPLFGGQCHLILVFMAKFSLCMCTKVA